MQIKNRLKILETRRRLVKSNKPSSSVIIYEGDLTGDFIILRGDPTAQIKLYLPDNGRDSDLYKNTENS